MGFNYFFLIYRRHNNIEGLHKVSEDKKIGI